MSKGDEGKGGSETFMEIEGSENLNECERRLISRFLY